MDTNDASRKRPLDEDSEGGVSKKSNQGGYDNVHLKILVPSIAAGAVIGKGGETITQIQKDYDVSIKMSKSQDYYPGTCERVCLVVGKNEAVLNTHNFISKKIREKPEANPKPSEIDGKINYERHKQVKILVPNSTAGMIIGKSGNHIKEIKEKSGAFIQISQKSKEMNLPERCITIAGDEEQCELAMELIVHTISEDPQSSSCPNISYHDYRGPVASANPSGSPFAAGAGAAGGRMENAPHEGGQMMQPQMHPQGPNMHHPGNQQNMNQGHGNQHGNPNVFNNLGSGMHNLTINGGAMHGGMQAGNQAGNTGGMNAVDTMRATLRGSGYTDIAIEEIINAVMILANYGLFGFSVNLGGLGLQQGPQNMGMLGNLANIMSSHQAHGPAPMATQGPMMNAQHRGAENTPQIFGPIGSTTTTKAGGDTGESSGFYSNASGMNGPRMGNNGESWGPGFNQGGGNGAFSGMNQNSFGLGMSGEAGEGDEQAQKEMEVGEHIVGAIIGPGGKGIIDIQNYTGANIQISKKGVFAPGTRNRVVSITGSSRSVQNAEMVIRQRISSEEMTRQRSGRQ